MSEINEFRASLQDPAMAISELRKRVDEHQQTLARHDQHIKRLDDFMVELRESLATKDDIQALRSDLNNRMDRSEIVDERLDHYRQRIVDLEDERLAAAQANEAKISRGFNWAVIALFAIEVIVGTLQLMEVARHA